MAERARGGTLACMSTGSVPAYPARVEGRLDADVSRWLWLFKWLLVIPHYVVLAFLWLAFVVLSIVAFFAILITGRYPRAIFDFNVGVLRWTWRVGFYAFAANGTDRYPPFTLAPADYPAQFDVDYPARLSRGLVLVKWWLLAIPQYVVVAVFVGGGSWALWQAGDRAVLYGGGLVGVLVFIAVVALLFTGRYPRGIFDLVLGMDRWVLRVAAYAGLMTDRYPPFRLDLGGTDPAAPGVRPDGPPPSAEAGEDAGSGGWSGGRIAAVVAGSLIALLGAGLLSAGVAGVVVDRTQRDDRGFVTSSTRFYSTATYALVSDAVQLDLPGGGWNDVLDDLVGDVTIRSTSADPVFVGIGPAARVSAYLAGVAHEDIGELGDRRATIVRGNTAPAAPTDRSFWVASSVGAGERALTWKVREGDWRAVVMAPDGHRGVRADLAVGAELPGLPGLSLGLLGVGILLLGAGGAAIAFAVTRQRRP